MQRVQVLWIIGPTALLIAAVLCTAALAHLDNYSVHEDYYMSVLRELEPDIAPSPRSRSARRAASPPTELPVLQRSQANGGCDGEGGAQVEMRSPFDEAGSMRSHLDAEAARPSSIGLLVANVT